MLLYVVQPANSESCTKGEDQDDEDLCIVCWEREREVIFCDCMHMCTCQSCASDVMAAGALCPMCRTRIHSTITVKF
ncbi:g6372 [Coccomyxa viridis]|uniref:G6372 protein n=1 Tax=Coccomyxa viridis TaxID=1274662 RepID=A0ABP1FV86_9CHLO